MTVPGEVREALVDSVASALVERWNVQPYQGQVAMDDAETAVDTVLSHLEQVGWKDTHGDLHATSVGPWEAAEPLYRIRKP